MKAVGGCDEAMFIDYVDFDYCKTVRERGFKILQLNKCFLEHQVGNNAKSVVIFGKKRLIDNRPLFRRYYFYRNFIYYVRKHKVGFWSNKIYYIKTLRKICMILFEQDRIKKFYTVFKGMFDGFRMELPQCYTNNN